MSIENLLHKMDGKLTCFNAVIVMLRVRQALNVNGITFGGRDR